MAISQNCKIDEIAVFIKKGNAVMLNLNNEFELGASVGNDVDSFINPCIYISGDLGEYKYSGTNVTCSINWTDSKAKLEYNSDREIYVLSSNKIINMEQVGTTKFNKNNLYIYKREEG